MFRNVKTLVKSAACMLVLAGSISACSTVLAPEDDATTEYVFVQSGSDVLRAHRARGEAQAVVHERVARVLRRDDHPAVRREELGEKETLLGQSTIAVRKDEYGGRRIKGN